MTVGLFKPRQGRAHTREHPMATPHEVLDRLKGDLDVLVVGVLDDLAFEIIRGYKNKPPPGYLEWVSTTATRRVRKLAHTLFRDRFATRSAWAVHGDLDLMRSVVARWLQEQMVQSFGPLPERVKAVFAVAGGNGPDTGLPVVKSNWLTRRRRQGLRI